MMEVVPSETIETPTRVDGRTARALRTRRAIVDACIALIEEGELRPTAPRIAEWAKVSVRSVFQHFEDLEGLYAAIADRVLERLAHLVVPIDRGLPLLDRIHRVVEQRSQLLESITPAHRAAAVQAPFSPAIRSRLQFGHDFLRAELEKVFGPELAARADNDRTRLLDALEVTLSWPSWETLRATIGRSPAEARVVLEEHVMALFRLSARSGTSATTEP